MVRVDSQRYIYCGGCVSVCPVEVRKLEIVSMNEGLDDLLHFPHDNDLPTSAGGFQRDHFPLIISDEGVFSGAYG